jgi:hypothetical protein
VTGGCRCRFHSKVYRRRGFRGEKNGEGADCGNQEGEEGEEVKVTNEVRVTEPAKRGKSSQGSL